MKKIKIEICVGTSCHLMGSNLILDYLENLSENIKTHLDISYHSCMNKCGKGPLLRIDGIDFLDVKPEDLEQELQKRL